MGRKKKEGGLGKTLIRDRFGKGNRKVSGDNFLHTTELNDGYEWGRLNLQSVTEQSNLDDFLATAELAGTEFTAEKLNVKFVDPNKNSGLLSQSEKANIECLQDQHRNLLRIPRRPAWDSSTTPEELDRREKAAFLEWRKSLSVLSEVEGILLTPYERNLDFWRQLWRVIERSDVVVQIVDARNPLLFRCEDVEAYVKEVNPQKVSLLLVNKADLLTEEQRKMWCDYFDSINLKVAFWSALAESERQKQLKLDENAEEDEDMDEEDENSDEYEDNFTDDSEELFSMPSGLSDIEKKMEDNDLSSSSEKKLKLSDDDKDLDTEKQTNQKSEDNSQTEAGRETPMDTNKDNALHKSSENDKTLDQVEESKATDKLMSENINDASCSCENETKNVNKSGDAPADVCCHRNTVDLLNGEQLIELFRSLHSGIKATQGQTTIGMVGYPNVGKSSTINAILKMKKVPVSATPGRTKHFQTLFVEKDLMLCDCPGLVFPSFVSTKAELVVNGILPIDQMRDHLPPVSLVCHNIPRQTLEEMYGINLPLPKEGEDPDRSPTAHELLNVYGTLRGFMTSNGLPDGPRTSRYILKDYVNGKLLYCEHPPGVDADTFKCACTVIPEEKKKIVSHTKAPQQSRLDREFFTKTDPKIHSKGVAGVANFARVQGVRQIGSTSGTDSTSSSMQNLNEKPWKKHHNVKKREKLRRVYRETDDD